MTEDNGDGFEGIETLQEAEMELDSLLVEELPDGAEIPGIWSMSAEQMREAEEFGRKFLLAVARLKGVRINRDDFLSAELHKRGFSDARVQAAILETPAGSGIPMETLDDISVSSIRLETNKSTFLSFATGVPGGFAMIGTIPADLTQYFVHTFRIMQKIAFTYGWKSFFDDADEVDDETLWKFTMLLGVMMGVGQAGRGLASFASSVAAPAVKKTIERQALTKTAWYLPLRKTLRIVGVKVTKETFAKSASKAVPLLGGVLSGALTYSTLRVQSLRLMAHVREIPPPNVDAAEYLATLRRVDEEAAEPSSCLEGSGMGEDEPTEGYKSDPSGQTEAARRGAALRRRGRSALQVAKEASTRISDTTTASAAAVGDLAARAQSRFKGVRKGPQENDVQEQMAELQAELHRLRELLKEDEEQR